MSAVTANEEDKVGDVNAGKAQPWLGLYAGVPPTVPPAAPTALEMFQQTVNRSPQAPVAYYFQTAVSAGELDTLSDHLAVAFQRSGVGAGDRIAMYLQNVPHVLITVLAAWKCGAVIVPCNPMLRGAELHKILSDSGSRALVCHRDLYRDVAKDVLATTAVDFTVTVSAQDFLHPNDIPALLTGVDEEPEGTTGLLELAARYNGQLPAPVTITGDDVAFMVYTSGTTGAPKAAMNTHANVVFATTVYQQWLNLTGNDVILGLAPLFHVTGLVGHVALALLSGAPLVLFYRFEAGEALRLVELHRATFSVSAVTAFIALLHSDAMARYDLSSLTKVYTGGAPTPPGVLEDWYQRTGSRIHPMYGLTEATSPTHMTPFGGTPPVDPRTGVISVGVPVFNTDVRIVTEDGHPAEPGEIGELLISGPQIIPGYWQKPEETAKTIIDGYLRTGDVGFMDADGWFYLVDRMKDMIVASGFKVWPREVEEVLYQHPAVLEAGVIGVPDPYRGETVKAFVTLRKGFETTADEIKAFARERMAAYKYPRQVEIVASLPKTTSGKIIRRALAPTAPAWTGDMHAPAILQDITYLDLREALEVRAVIESGSAWLLLRGADIPRRASAELYARLQKMVAHVRADGSFIDRDGFLDANNEYHQYLVGLSGNILLSRGFAQLRLRQLFSESMKDTTATSTEMVIQHERLTDAIAAGNAAGAHAAIVAWAQVAVHYNKVAMGTTLEEEAVELAAAHEAGSHDLNGGAEFPENVPASDCQAALADALDARAALEIGVLRTTGSTLIGDDRERLAARLLALTPLVRGDDESHITRYVEADDRYHRALLGVMTNRALLNTYAGFGVAHLIRQVLADAPSRLRDEMDDHGVLTAALTDGDLDAACAAIADHAKGVRAALAVPAERATIDKPARVRISTGGPQ